MIYHEQASRPAHIETYHEGGFFVVEWTDENQNLEIVVNEEFGNEGWIKRHGNRERFLKAFVGKKNGIFKIWLTADTIRGHHYLFSSIPNDERKNIMASGELVKETMSFVIAAITIYEKMILDRDVSIRWVSENLPNLI